MSQQVYHYGTESNYEVVAWVCQGIALVDGFRPGWNDEEESHLALWTGVHSTMHVIADQDGARRAAALLSKAKIRGLDEAEFRSLPTGADPTREEGPSHRDIWTDGFITAQSFPQEVPVDEVDDVYEDEMAQRRLGQRLVEDLGAHTEET